MSAPRMIRVTCPKCSTAKALEIVNPLWLREVRERAGYSLRATAKAIGISAPYLCDVELGRRACSTAVRDYYEAMAKEVR